MLLKRRVVGTCWPITDHLMSVNSENVNLYMEVAAWIDMGRPDSVTITIEPGDLLNDDEACA